MVCRANRSCTRPRPLPLIFTTEQDSRGCEAPSACFYPLFSAMLSKGYSIPGRLVPPFRESPPIPLWSLTVRPRPILVLKRLLVFHTPRKAEEVPLEPKISRVEHLQHINVGSEVAPSAGKASFEIGLRSLTNDFFPLSGFSDTLSVGSLRTHLHSPFVFIFSRDRHFLLLLVLPFDLSSYFFKFSLFGLSSYSS